MKSVGAFAAKTHLSSLLDRVEQGEEITITRHGRAVAVLTPAAREGGGGAARELIEDIKRLRSGLKSGGLRISRLAHERHKY
ncbi:MAG: type II toxin-antitoxin system prevent-host-death family antitoxin [Nitrospinae bacterium]|nr:type II toxin-antitoxin system prevent-host-death family antitoxin [Nitrospinota bacterium]